MPGVRIHHPTERNCVLLVPHPGEIKGLIRTRNKGRKAKDYRITLDSDGNAIVSETVWNRLQEAGANFLVLNEVTEPPALIVGLQEGTVETLAVKKEINKAIQDIAPPGVTTYIARHRG